MVLLLHFVSDGFCSAMQPNALGKVFNFVLRQGQDSKPSTSNQESASADSAAQAESDTSPSILIEPTTIILADNAEVARHQQRRYVYSSPWQCYCCEQCQYALWLRFNVPSNAFLFYSVVCFSLCNCYQL